MPLNIDWQQILLHLLNFVALFAILYFLLYSPVKEFIDKRTKYYKDLEDERNNNLSESEKLKEEYLKKLESADSEIEVMKSEAQKDIEKSSLDKMEKAKEEAEKIIADARLGAEKQRTKILKEAEKEIAKMVEDATEKLIIDSTEKAYDEFLDSVERGESHE
ncbi:MAG: ATP synthase F0 subunit B [Clostridia bacterium]|nr:ATP synthase F0 subunit B [Clostridia bacterium]